ncbi:MAG: hypothetical protein R3264_18160 [Anaerolineae bacterium]|nr:hypothetical protein [Anaerolineae bacterium]
MTVQGINLQLPPAIYQRLVEVAEASQQSLTDVVIQSIQTGLPPGLERVPDRFRDDLITLNRLSDDVLWGIADRDLTEDKAEHYEQLLAKIQQGQLAESEQSILDTLREEADLLMLQRAYATALLKWRGHRISSLVDIQMP